MRDLSELISGNNSSGKTIITFNLSNGRAFSMSTDEDTTKPNYFKSIKLKEALNLESNMPVGINTSNLLNLVIISTNKALVPNNENSAYYGYMNNTAILNISFYDNDSQEAINLGKYYVKSWTSETSSSEGNKVEIQATNLMSLYAQQEVPDIIIDRGTRFNTWLNSVITNISSKMSSDKKATTDLDFSNFPQMQFCNIDYTKLDNALNQISQCTLTNIYCDRANCFKTDYAPSLSDDDAVYKLDILTNVVCKDEYLVDYDGVVITYSNGDINSPEQIGAVYNKAITTDGLYNEDAVQIRVPDNIYKINSVIIKSMDDMVLVSPTSITYNKNIIKISLASTGTTTFNCIVMGQKLDTSEQEYTKYNGNNNLRVTNKIIMGVNAIDTYASELSKLIDIKEDTIRIEGMINPKIKISDTIYVDANGAIGLAGYYKVVELNWTFTKYSKCSMKLVKVIENTVEE